MAITKLGLDIQEPDEITEYVMLNFSPIFRYTTPRIYTVFCAFSANLTNIIMEIVLFVQ